MNLKDITKQIVSDWVSKDKLFTALDVSLEVKKQLPFARHSEVRDEVKTLYMVDIEPFSYGKTLIDVTLKDGNVAQAMLYHPLADTWDLDSKYSSQQRAASSAKNVQTVVVTVTSNPTQPVQQATVVPAPVTPVTVDPPQGRSLWANLFDTTQSLFPRK